MLQEISMENCLYLYEQILDLTASTQFPRKIDWSFYFCRYFPFFFVDLWQIQSSLKSKFFFWGFRENHYFFISVHC